MNDFPGSQTFAGVRPHSLLQLHVPKCVVIKTHNLQVVQSVVIPVSIDVVNHQKRQKTFPAVHAAMRLVSKGQYLVRTLRISVVTRVKSRQTAFQPLRQSHALLCAEKQARLACQIPFSGNNKKFFTACTGHLVSRCPSGRGASWRAVPLQPIAATFTAHKLATAMLTGRALAHSFFAVFEKDDVGHWHKKQKLVEEMGLEPTTPCLQSRCSTS